MTRKHIPTVHKDCDRYPCQICGGGLSLCTVCGCLEGGLASECPGELISMEQQDKIYSGEVDFVDNAWVTPGSPPWQRHIAIEERPS